MKQGTLERRDYSTIERDVIDVRGVYIKNYLPGGSYQTPEEIRTQLRREVDLVSQIAHLPGLGGRLGVLRIVEYDIAALRMVTEEAPGRELQDTLCTADRGTRRHSCAKALFLACKWIRVFQTLPIDSRAIVAEPEQPIDLVEFCDQRLATLKRQGYRWASSAMRERILRFVRDRVAVTPAELRREVWCHEDFGPFNILWDGNVLTPIDFSACRPDLPLLDVTHLIHRLEMLPIQFPWTCWPVAMWKQACLRGYGLPHAERLPIYDALMVRHLLARLKKSLLYQPKNLRQKYHNLWCRNRVRVVLSRLVCRNLTS